MTEFAFLANSQATIYLFPGQGSQHVGMAQELAAVYPAARLAMEEADDILGFPLSRLCFSGPEDVLTDTVNAQPALMAASIATLRALQSELDHRGILGTSSGNGSTVLVAGHSMGEYTALVAAGSLSYVDGLRLVRERGRLMKEAGNSSPGMMAAILGLNEETVAAVCAEATRRSGVAQVANDNCPGQVVISGDAAGMEAAIAALSAAGARKVVPLAVSIAAHSPLMAPAAAELSAAIDNTPLQPATLPVIANTSAIPVTAIDDLRAELKAQLTGSVRWAASMRHAVDAHVTRFVEVGPGNVLSGLVKRIERTSQRFPINDRESLADFAAQWHG